MRESFTDDDRGKRVENEAGEELGTITAVEGETALVEPRSGVMDSIRAALGWRTSDGRRVSIGADAVSARMDDAIQLGADAAATDPSTDANEPERRRDDGETPTGTGTDRPLEGEDHEPASTERGERAAPPDRDPEPTAASRDDPNRPPAPVAEPSAEGAVAEPLEEPAGDEPTEDATADRDDEARAEPTEDAQGDDDHAAANRAGRANPADEPSEGIDPASPESAAESEPGETAESEPGEDADREESTDDRDIADESNRGGGVDDVIEPVGPEGWSRSKKRDADATDLADELDAGPDVESAIGTDAESGGRADEGDERSEASEAGGDEASRAGTRERTDDARGSLEERASTATLDPGLDVVSTARSHRKPESIPGAEAFAGGRGEASVDPETGARSMPEARESAPTAGDRATPIAVAVDAQRAVLKGSREAAELGFTMQQNAARAALQGQAFAQRASLELATATTRGYLHALAGTTGSERRTTDEETIRSLEATTTALEDALAHVDEADFARDLAVYLERVRAVQTESDEGRTVRSERIVDLLERGADLLERCGRGLDGSA